MLVMCAGWEGEGLWIEMGLLESVQWDLVVCRDFLSRL